MVPQGVEMAPGTAVAHAGLIHALADVEQVDAPQSVADAFETSPSEGCAADALLAMFDPDPLGKQVKASLRSQAHKIENASLLGEMRTPWVDWPEAAPPSWKPRRSQL